MMETQDLSLDRSTVRRKWNSGVDISINDNETDDGRVVRGRRRGDGVGKEHQDWALLEESTNILELKCRSMIILRFKGLV